MPTGDYRAPLPAYLPITGSPTLMRDTKSRGIVSTDTRGGQAIRQQRKSVLDMRQKLSETQTEVATLRQEVEDLKNLIRSNYPSK